MSGCLDNIRCECGIDFGEKRNSIASIVSGVLFFVGWWIAIDCTAKDDGWNNLFHIIGVIGTIAFFMTNAVSNSQVRGDAMTDGLLGTRGSRVWLLTGFTLSFGALVAALWIMFADYVITPAGAQPVEPWPGVALFLTNFLIFIGSVVYKFGRTEELWN